ncbi:FadR family transcriptional regulator [Arachnia propionica]|uniref:FadR family transcriptional regulator n=1 Tax=Arachnia propionica TaxID=1750 RepID=A0A3P1TCV6_9ACTN|nr:GntR family transcriptional regulator [Arachnia propionica]MDO5081890.1 GntR family transcriptional regulator [Arachnia propionica]RRD07259.1 FadR family transcriptional regulator [Arachnia propionica]
MGMERLDGARRGARGGRTLARETASQIKQFIIASRLHPGDPLPSEAELCERLGVSRSSVREAIRTLNTLEIVEVQHGRGTFVGQASLQPLVETLVFRAVMVPGDDFKALREVVEVRESLDLSEADRVCARLRGTRNADLHDLVDIMVAAAERGESFGEEDREFHTRLLKHTGLDIIAQLVAAFWDVHSVVLPQLSIPAPDDIELTARAHGDMLCAAEAGDSQAYRRAVRDHYAPLRRVLERTDHG